MDLSVARRLFGEARPFYGRLAVAMLLGVLAGIAPLALTLIPALLFGGDVRGMHVHGVIDYRHVEQGVVVPTTVHWGTMWIVAAVILFSQSLGALAGYGQSYLTAFAGQRMIAGFRLRMFDRVNRWPLADFDRWRPGELVARLSSDLTLMMDAVSISLPQLIQVTVTFLGALLTMVSLDWVLALVLLASAPVVSYTISKTNRLVVGATRRAQDRIADVTANLTEVLQNERVVKAFRREDFERERFGETNERYFGDNLKVTQLNQTQAPVIATIVSLAIVALVVATVREIGVGRIDPAQTITFWGAAALMINPMNRLGIFLGDFSRALVGARRVFEILDAPEEAADPPDAVAVPRIVGDIVFDGVVFAYEAGAPVLDGFSATMRHGEVVALVGPSGGGKTTIVNLVPRFYVAQGGRVTVDGVDVRQMRLADLRGAIAIVPQETQLFNGSIRENIRYGRLDASDAEVERAAAEANAAEFIDRLPEGYDTVVGERGLRLSGGQRQRIAIARAILRDPRILILDEATSALDSHSERLIEEALDRLLPGRTTIVIAHRLSTIRRATTILYIEGGRVRERGTHDDLVAAGGAYASLHAAQAPV